MPGAITPPQPLSIASLAPAATAWLFPHLLPAAKITLLAGPPGSGKSFIACDLAARITTGTPLPPTIITHQSDQPQPAQPGAVLLITPQQDLADTAHPHLIAAKAALDKCFILRDTALDSLKAGADQIPDLKLVIIDPLALFTTANTPFLPPHKLLALLHQHLQPRGVATLATVPMFTGRGDPINRILQLSALVPLATVVLAASPTHHDADTILQSADHVLVQLKNNLTPLAAPIGFTIKNGAVAYDKIASNQPPRQLLTLPPIPSGPKPAELDACTQWLYEQLRNQSLPYADVTSAARTAGFSERTLRRAKQALRVQARRSSDGSWLWHIRPGSFDYDEFSAATDEILRTTIPPPCPRT